MEDETILSNEKEKDYNGNEEEDDEFDDDSDWEEEEIPVRSKEEEDYYEAEMDNREDILYEAVFNELFQLETKDMSYKKRLKLYKFFSRFYRPKLIAYFGGMPVRMRRIRRRFQKVRRLFRRGGSGINTMHEEAYK